MDFSQLNSHSPEIRSHLSKAPHVGDPKQENSISLIGTTWTTNFVENNISMGKIFDTLKYLIDEHAQYGPTFTKGGQ